eukprot:UC4_evm2s125
MRKKWWLYPLPDEIVCLWPLQILRLNLFEKWSSILIERASESSDNFVIVFSRARPYIGTKAKIEECRKWTVSDAYGDHPHYSISLRGICRVTIEDKIQAEIDGYGLLQGCVLNFEDWRESSIVESMRKKIANLSELKHQAHALVADFHRRYCQTKSWRTTIASCGPPPNEAHCSIERLSMWLCSVVQRAIDPDDILDFFESTSSPYRLQGALNLFKKKPPHTSHRQTDMRVMSTAEQRLLHHTGGLKEFSTACPSLSSLAVAACCDYQAEVSHCFVYLRQTALQSVISELCDRGTMNLKILQSLAGSSVTSISLSGAAVTDLWIKACYRFEKLQHLSLTACYNVSSQAIGEMPLNIARSLVSLTINRSKKINDTAISHLVRHMKKLRSLSVSGTWLSFDTLHQIKDLPALKEIDISSLPCVDDSLAAQLFSKTALRAIICDESKIKGEAAKALSSSSIEVLSLKLSPGVDNWCPVLKKLTRLVDLDLSLNYKVDDAVFQCIADNLPHLLFLNVARTSIEEVTGALTKLGSRGLLKALDMSSTQINDTVGNGLETITSLKSLSLAFTNVGSGLALFLKSARLRTLKLTGCEKFGTEGVHILSSLPNLQTSLNGLEIGGRLISNDVADDDYLPRLSSLESLQLWETNVGAIAAEQLKTKLKLELDDHAKNTQGTWIMMTARRLEDRWG